MWGIDIRDMLDRTFTRPGHRRLSSKVKKIGQIISYASAMESGISVVFRPLCWRKTKRYPCRGMLNVTVHKENIHCECPECGDEGVITGWKGLIWDLSVFRTSTQN